jgi:hypothetical protein
MGQEGKKVPGMIVVKDCGGASTRHTHTTFSTLLKELAHHHTYTGVLVCAKQAGAVKRRGCGVAVVDLLRFLSSSESERGRAASGNGGAACILHAASPLLLFPALCTPRQTHHNSLTTARSLASQLSLRLYPSISAPSQPNPTQHHTASSLLPPDYLL